MTFFRHHQLDDEELSALLQHQAFAASRRRKIWFWLTVLLSLFIVIMTLFGLLTEPDMQRLPPVNNWNQGELEPVKDSGLFSCLQQWGKQRELPLAEKLIIHTASDQWSLIWLTANNSYNFTMTGRLEELCK